MNFTDTPLGKINQGKDFVFFFGNAQADLETLKIKFPALQFARLKQTHSDIVVASDHPTENQVIGDAHFTDQAGLALVSVTADCVPILIYDQGQKRIAAVHAGWRGVAQRILPKTISALLNLGSHSQDLILALGPHIQFQSFEVGTDVKEQILASVMTVKPNHFLDLSQGKARVNLLGVLQSQLDEMQISKKQCWCSHEDTFKNLSLHSFRRDRDLAGRQCSFIQLTSVGTERPL